MSTVPFMNVEEYQTNIKSKKSFSECLVSKSREDESRANKVEYIGLFIMFSLLLIYFIYEVVAYYNYDSNSTTRTGFESVSLYDTPYFYIYGSGYIYDMSFDYVNVNGIYGDYYEILTINKSESFVNGVTNKDQWCVVDLSGLMYEVLLIPPVNAKLNVSDTLSFYIYSEGQDTNMYASNFSSSSDAVLQMYMDATNFALYWFADAVENLQNIDSYSEDRNYEFSFVSSINYVSLQIYEEVDNIKNTQDMFYDSSIYASVINSVASYDYNTTYWGYTTEFVFGYDVTGDGYKTVVTTDYLKTFWDVLASTGGLFGPLSAFCNIMTLIIVFGISIGSKKYFGYAKCKPLDEKNKIQLMIFLEELGLIDTNNYQAMLIKQNLISDNDLTQSNLSKLGQFSTKL